MKRSNVKIKLFFSIYFLALEPVLYNISNSSVSNRMEFSVTKQSDYSSLELLCDGSVYNPFICSNLTKQTSSCYNTLNYIDGSPGCNYQCVFITKKINYIDRSTDKFQLVFGKFRSILALKLKKILNLAHSRPSEYDISTKIIPQEFHILSTSEQFVIDIYRSLFSNTYGDIQYLKIYVRQCN